MNHGNRRYRKHHGLARSQRRKGLPRLGYRRPVFESLEARWLLSALSVVSVQPPANSHLEAPDSEISATYDQAVDSTSVTAQSFVVHGMQSGEVLAAPGALRVSGDTISSKSSEPFHPGELVQVSATTRVENLDGEQPEDPLVWQFRAGTSGGTGMFGDSGQLLGNSDSRAVALGDVDGDGDLDAFVANHYDSADRVWLNDGSGTFRDSGQRLGDASSVAVVLGDVDADGDLDAFVANYFGSDTLWLNDGSGTFRDSGQRLGDASSAAVALGDVDGDGDLDACVTHGERSTVWLNDGHGRFADGGQRIDSAGSGVAFGDMDGDGDLDAFIWDSRDRPNSVWLNDGQGNFTASGQRLGGEWSGAVALGDVDGDGDLDALVGRSNPVWLNDGNGRFHDSGQSLVGESRNHGVALGDVDGDGDLDALFGNAYEPCTMWINDGHGGFSESGQVLDSSGGSTEVALGDLDGDGDLDAFVGANGDYYGAPNRVWLNADIAADLSATNTNGQSVAAPGQSTTYTLSVANQGPESVIGASVTDIFPKPIIDVTWTCTASAGSSCTASGTGDIRDTVSLLAGGTATYTATGTFDVGALGRIENVVRVVAPGGAQDIGPANNTAIDIDVSAPNVNPPFNSHTAAVTTDIAAAYIQDVNMTSVSDQTFSVHGMQTGQLLTPANDWRVEGQTITVSPTQTFHAGELVEVSATAGIENAAGAEVNSPFVWQFRAGTSGGTGWFADSRQMIGRPTGLTRAVALGDVDGDGDLDAWVANGQSYARHPNYVWLNDGEGHFRDSGQNLGNSRSFFVALGDLDGDDDLDAFVANDDQPNRVWLNDGNGGFRDSGQGLGESHSRAVALGDLDDDGDLDAFVANHQGSPNTVWMNDGSGRFYDSGQRLGDAPSVAVALGDVDGDGDLDAFEGNGSHPDRVWLNDGRGYFRSSGQSLGDRWRGWDSRAVALGDLDGDGDLDALALGSGQSNTIWLNDGAGRFDIGQDDLGRSRGTAVAIGDMDGDGDVDALIGNGRGEPNQVLLNDGSGRFRDSGQSLGASDSLAVVLGDLDGDGDLDGFFGNSGPFGEANTVWLNDGHAQLSRSDQILGSVAPAVALGDLDGDGDVDAFIVNQGANQPGAPDEVWLNDGQGRLHDTGQRLGVSDSLAVALGDVDGDGDLDALVGSGDGQPNRVWLNDGWGVFRDSGQIRVGWQSAGVAFGDLDGDGDLDAFLANSNHPDNDYQPNTVWLNDGQGVFQDSGQRLGEASSRAVALGDLDDDGDLDAIVSNGGFGGYRRHGCGPNTVWLNDGQAQFYDSGQRLGNSFSHDVALGDLDSDGDLDALFANHAYFHGSPGGSPDAAWINDGHGRFTHSGQSLGESESFAVALGDLDGDGDLDALVGNFGSVYSGGVGNKVWTNDGHGQFSESAQSLGEAASRDVALGDLDGDGDLDALVGNHSQSNRIWLNENTALDLSVTKTNDAKSVRPGQITTYTITVTNHGPEKVVGAKVTDVFPAQITSVDWTCIASAGSTCTAHGVGDVLDSVSLAVDGTVTYTATGTVDGTANGEITSEATVKTPTGVADNRPANNSGSNTLAVVGDAVWDGRTPIGRVGNGRTWADARNWTVNGISDRPPADGPAGDDVTLTAGSTRQRIDLGEPRTANSVTFQSGYVLTGDTLTITSGDITVEPNVTATIDAEISRANGLTKRGDGTLVVGGVVGDVVVESGSLQIHGRAGDIVVQSGMVTIDGRARDTVVETGTIDGIGFLSALSVQQGGSVSPGGDSTGTLSSRSTTIAGTMLANLDTDTDLLHARGTVTLSPGSTLDLRAIGSLGVVGDTFRQIIFSSEEVTGTFTVEPTTGQHLGFGVFTAEIAGTGLAIGYLRRGVMVGLFQAAAGDANGDGQFDQTDLISVLQANKYRTGQPATFDEGDWNGDDLFDQRDLVVALQTGDYSQRERPR